MSNRIIAFIDGSCYPNPGGESYAGVYIPEQEKMKKIVFRTYLGNGKTSNNHAEYCAAIAALLLLDEYRDSPITIYSDSKLLVNQMNGTWGVNNGGVYLKAYQVLKKRLEMFNDIRFSWIPRERNEMADAICKGMLVRS